MVINGVQMKIIGIIGINGKTTTAKMIGHILKNQGTKVGFINANEIMIDDRFVSNDGIHGDKERLFSCLRSMANEKVETLIMEIDEAWLKKEDVYGIAFDMVVHTNMDGDEEAGYDHGSSSMEVFKEVLHHLSENGIAVINIDDRNTSKLLEGIEDRLMITYGLCSKATITASSIDMSPYISFNCCIQRGMTATNGMEIEPMEFHVLIPLLGRHNVYNSLGAISAVLMAGILPNDIQGTLESFKGIKRRMYLIHHDKYRVIDDMSHNPQSYEAVFEAIQSMDYNNLLMVNAIIGNGGLELNKNNATIISSWYGALKSPKIMTTSSVDKVSSADCVLEAERDVFHRTLQENGIVYEHKDTLQEALEATLSKANDNDLILLLGQRGMDEGEEVMVGLL